MKKSKENKSRTTLYLEDNILIIADREIENLSATVNFLLRNYLRGNSVEIIDNEIREHEEKIKTLKIKRNILLKQNAAENEEQKLIKNIYEDIKSRFIKYVKFQGFDESAALSWITGPTNKRALKIMEKTPEELLGLLKGELK